MPGLTRTLLSLEVLESDKGKEYWASRSWLSPETAARVRSACFVVVPWENFRNDSPILFPLGTTDFVAILNTSELAPVVIAVDQDSYREIALHANEWRLPTILCTTVLLPVFLNVLSNHVDRWLFSHQNISIVEEELIVDDENGRCFSIRYKGPPEDLITTFHAQAEACLQPRPTRHGAYGRVPAQKPHLSRK